jgi:hypothetical protein
MVDPGEASSTTTARPERRVITVDAAQTAYHGPILSLFIPSEARDLASRATLAVGRPSAAGKLP